jgi:PAS domain S-box-containing protein
VRDITKNKYDINSTTCIIIVSGNTNDLGKCITLNNDVKKLYEFSNKEIIGQEINKIMPPVYEKLHTQFLKNFFEDRQVERKSLHEERVVYAVNKKGYLIPSSLMIKLMPDFKNSSIRIVGFLNHEASYEHLQGKQCLLMFQETTFHLLGITEYASKAYKIPLSLISGAMTSKTQDFRLDMIFEGIGEDSIYEKA